MIILSEEMSIYFSILESKVRGEISHKLGHYVKEKFWWVEFASSRYYTTLIGSLLDDYL